MAKIILTKVQEEKLRKNERNFLAAEHPEQGSASLFSDLHEFFINHLMIAYDFTSRTMAENLIEQKLQSSSINDFALQLSFSMIERLYGGRYQDAAEFFVSYQDWLRGKHAEKSRVASMATRSSRKGDIGRLIEDIVNKNLAISESDLLKELKKHVGVGVIDVIDDTHIYGKENQVVALSALRGRLSRAKKLKKKTT